ncbi:APC family permease [Kineococcus sp. TBRC 1896]|uniref:APC family permease n=1 Tax=Kineococcus mangrovi TaxID=1660183 RepID=A0ABV4HZB1_9ACTN
MDPAINPGTTTRPAGTAGTPPGVPDDQLKGSLGATGITAMVVAAAAPLTVMTGIAPLAIAIGGIGAPAGYLAALVVLAIFAVGFTTMTRVTGGAGAFYSYITLGLGRSVGAAAGLVAVMSYNALQVGLYGLLGLQFQATVARLTGLTLPWWLYAFGAIAVVWALGRRGIDVGARLLGVLLAAETLVLAVLVVAIVVRGGANGLSLTTFSPEALRDPGLIGILGFCFAAFAGFESTALYRREARHPERSIPRATFGAVAFLGLFYALVVWAVVQALGDTEARAAAGADPVTLFTSVMDRYAGAWATDVMAVLVLTSVLAAQIAFHNAINRYSFTLARDGLLPAALAHAHPRFASPARAGAAQSVLALVVVAGAALIGADPYLQLVIYVNTPGAIGIMALQTLTSVAVVVHLRRRPDVSALVKWISVLAAVLLTAATGLMVRHVGVLTGAPTGTNAVLVAIVPAALLLGVVLAQLLRARRPDLYARIGGES